MKVCLFGCKSNSLLVARQIVDQLSLNTIITISEEKGEKAQVADFKDLAPWCKDSGVNLYTAKRYDQKCEDDLAFFEEERFDIGFVNGWQRLVPDEILTTFKVGVFGMHGSASDLPIGRGRSPMNWSLIEGRRVFYTNMFKYAPGVDDGDVIDTLAFTINEQDTAETLHYKNSISMSAMIKRNAEKFLSEKLQYRRQNDKLVATYYPKRAPDDSLIDWSSPIDNIERFIRAVSPPFNGAFTFHKGIKVSIMRAAIFELSCVDFHFKSADWGTVLEVFENGKFIVKVPGGILIIHEYISDGFNPRPGDFFDSNGIVKKVFARNSDGGHDIENLY